VQALALSIEWEKKEEKSTFPLSTKSLQNFNPPTLFIFHKYLCAGGESCYWLIEE